MQDNGVRTQTIKLAEATPHPENYNEHDTAQLARLRGSLAAFGYVRRIVVQEHAGDVCYEPFSGSGSQIMAGEKTGRRVFAIEKEPVFVAAALERWHLATGETPTLTNA